MAASNHASGLWDNLAIWPAGTPAGGPAGNTPVTIIAGTEVSTDPARDSGALTRTATTTINGDLTISESGDVSIETNFGNLAISAGGTFSTGTDSDQYPTVVIVNGGFLLSGQVTVQPGLDNSGSLTLNLNWCIRDGATIVNYTPTQYIVNAGWYVIDSNGDVGGTPCTWSLRQYVDAPPGAFTLTFVQAWTDVAINANLGGISIFSTDYAGNLLDPLQPPIGMVYRNGILWTGVIQVTRRAQGQFVFDLNFADGVWQLGDHGEIHVFWNQLGSDEVTPQWFCAIYYWLVNRLNYETWERVMKALPDAVSGSPGGLPVLDGDGWTAESPNTARFQFDHSDNVCSNDAVAAALSALGASHGILIGGNVPYLPVIDENGNLSFPAGGMGGLSLNINTQKWTYSVNAPGGGRTYTSDTLLGAYTSPGHPDQYVSAWVPPTDNSISAEMAAAISEQPTVIVAPVVGVVPPVVQPVELSPGFQYSAYQTVIAVVQVALDGTLTPVALTGKSLELEVFSFDSQVVAFKLTTSGTSGDNLTVDGTTTNNVHVAISAAHTAGTAIYRWILWDTSIVGQPVGLLKGTWSVGSNPAP